MRRCLAILPLVAALLTACGAPDDAESSAALERWVLEEELRIGSVDDPELSLTSIGSVSVGPDGRVYVAQPMDQRVRVFDAEGRPVGAIGRRGGGPGEFESVGGMAWRGDTLWVSDWRHRRFSLFTPEGTLLETVTPPPPTASTENPRPAYPTSLLPDGSLMGSASLPSHLIASGEITHWDWVRFDAGGNVLDTVASLPLENSQLHISYGNNGMLFTRQPFNDGPLTAVHPDTSFLVLDRRVTGAEAPSFTLTKLRLGGDTVFQRSYPYQPLPVTASEADSLAAAWAEGLREGRMLDGIGGRGAAVRLYREAMYVPSHRPPVRTMRVGRDGTVWLHMTDADPDAGRHLVLDPDGEPRAEVHVPSGTNLRHIDGGVVWASETDELDVPYLVRYRLVRQDGDVAAASEGRP